MAVDILILNTAVTDLRRPDFGFADKLVGKGGLAKCKTEDMPDYAQEQIKQWIDEGTATAGDETAAADADGNGDSGPGEPGGDAAETAEPADAEPTGAEASGDAAPEAGDEPADGEQNEKDQA